MSEDDLEQANARADLCRYLSACFYEPGPEFTEEGLFDSMLEVATRIHPDLAGHARQLGTAYSAQAAQALLVDYSRLFLGPVQPLVKPYGSVWLSGASTLMQDSSMGVLDLYRQGGFDLDDEFRELPDHVAVELEFLYLLNFKLNRARYEVAGDDAACLADLRQHFLARHLGAWIGPFCAALQHNAETAFYRELGAFTERFVRMEQGIAASAH